MSIKAIIFDMYGVIMEDPNGCLAAWIMEKRPCLSEEEVLRVWRKLHLNQIDTMMFWAELGFTGDLAAVEKEYLDSLFIDGGFTRTAKALKKKHKIALLSNDASVWSKYLRGRFGLDPYFDAVAVSGDYPFQKPNPALYRVVLDKLSLAPNECIFIDDRKKNLDAARSLGIKPILFRRPGLDNKGYSGLEIKSFSELESFMVSNGY